MALQSEIDHERCGATTGASVATAVSTTKKASLYGWLFGAEEGT